MWMSPGQGNRGTVAGLTEAWEKWQLLTRELTDQWQMGSG